MLLPGAWKDGVPSFFFGQLLNTDTPFLVISLTSKRLGEKLPLHPSWGDITKS